jgi:hypothetical protein
MSKSFNEPGLEVADFVYTSPFPNRESAEWKRRLEKRTLIRYSITLIRIC